MKACNQKDLAIISRALELSHEELELAPFSVKLGIKGRRHAHPTGSSLFFFPGRLLGCLQGFAHIDRRRWVLQAAADVFRALFGLQSLVGQLG